MNFVKSVDPSEGQASLLNELTKGLKEGPVLWLLTAGQNIPVEVAILNQIDTKLTPKLFLLLSDERYGPKGHKDSNYLQLINTLNIKEAIFPDILEGNPSPEEAVRTYLDTFKKFKNQAKITIAQFGIGDDGHIAGVLPDTPGCTSKELIIYYESKPYKRLTMTLEALKQIDETFVFCFGPQKNDPLTRLKEGKEDLSSLPSAILNNMKSVTIYNDQV